MHLMGMHENTETTRRDPKPAYSRGAFIFLFLFSLPFALTGTGAFFYGLNNVLSNTGDSEENWVLMIVGILFAGIGWGLIWGLSYAKKAIKKEDLLKQLHPDEPWRWKLEWCDGKIKGGNKNLMIGGWIFALIWNLISMPAAFLGIPKELAKGNKDILFILIFPIIGAGLLAWAIYSTLRWRKFGSSVFQMKGPTGIIGGRLEGYIRTNFPLEPLEDFEVKLKCVNRVTTGSGDSQSTTDYTKWEDSVLFPMSENRFITDMPVSFLIPYELPEWSEDDSRSSILWILSVSVPLKGVDFSATFNVPVFKTPSSSPEITEESTAKEKKFSCREGSYQLKSKGVDITPSQSGIIIRYGMCRSMSAIFSAGFFGLIWTCILYLIVIKKAPFIFLAAFGFFEIIIILILLNLVFGSRIVTVTGKKITAKRSFLGIAGIKEIPAEFIDSIKPVPGTQSGRKTYYRIIINRKNGGTITAGTMLENKRDAEWIIGEMKKLIH